MTFVIPPDHVWRQSSINEWLRCGRACELEATGVEPRHELDGWAALIGDAVHVGIASVLRTLRDELVRPSLVTVETGPTVNVEAIANVMHDAFASSVARAQDEGGVTDPDGVAAALERVSEQAQLVAALSIDPRVLAIEWRGIEEPFTFEDAHGRKFSGTRDAWGVALRRIEAFAANGLELAAVDQGDVVLVDWKSGQDVAVDHVARSLNVQLAIYRTGLPADARVRSFIGVVRDLERPKRPKDGEGVIPSRLKEENPAWRKLVDEGMAPAAASRRAPKWTERPNPAYAEATSRPRGPVFHEARIDWPTVSRTVADVIDAARLGIFPASGASTGQCRRCAFRTRCAHAAQDPARPITPKES